MGDSTLLLTGITTGGKGVFKPFSGDITGAQRVSTGNGVYTDVTYWGKVFAAANQTGVTTQAGLSASTPALTLYNPMGSGKIGVLIYAGCVNTVAFAAASVIWIGANTNISAAAVTGTAATVRNSLLGNGVQSSLQAFTAATLPAAPVAVATLGVGLTGAITTTPTAGTLGRFFDGSLIVYPGAAISIQTSTASGASGLFAEFIWAELDIVS